MAMTRNTIRRRKQGDPIFLRMHLLGKVEGVKAKIIASIAKGDVEDTKAIDAMLADAFTAKPVRKAKD